MLLSVGCVYAFQSDELQEEDEEWGIVGALNNQKINVEQVTARSPRHSDASLPTTSPDSKVVFPLDHSFGDSADFVPAGTFSARLRTLHHGGQTLTKLRLSRSSFTSQEQEAFKALVNEDGFYRIRVPANVLGSGQEMILSSVKARCLAADNLREHFDFYLDRGNIIAVGYGARDCSYPRDFKYPMHWTFDSYIVLKSGEQSARSAVVENDVEVELGEDGQPIKPVEKSFWAKYWIYIVPLGLIFMNQIVQVANMADEPTGQSGASQQRAVSAGPRRR